MSASTCAHRGADDPISGLTGLPLGRRGPRVGRDGVLNRFLLASLMRGSGPQVHRFSRC